jgi:hypothetical protein
MVAASIMGAAIRPRPFDVKTPQAVRQGDEVRLTAFLA